MPAFKANFSIFWVWVFTACQNSTGNIFHETTNRGGITTEQKTGRDGKLEMDSSLFQKHLQKLKQMAAKHNYSVRYAIMIDLGLHSGSMRCFFVDLTNEKQIHAGLVTHGSSPSLLKPGERQYSNTSGSLCSSLGVYKIGNSYQGTFGLAYKLHGLDSTNNNAYARAVVLHSHSCVPDKETDEPICQSWGCPTVSPEFLKFISTYIDESSRPMLMDIYDGN